MGVLVGRGTGVLVTVGVMVKVGVGRGVGVEVGRTDSVAIGEGDRVSVTAGMVVGEDNVEVETGLGVLVGVGVGDGGFRKAQPAPTQATVKRTKIKPADCPLTAIDSPSIVPRSEHLP